jgi:hypothetical protein
MWIEEDSVLALVLGGTTRTADAPGIGFYQSSRRHISKIAISILQRRIQQINKAGKR